MQNTIHLEKNLRKNRKINSGPEYRGEFWTIKVSDANWHLISASFTFVQTIRKNNGRDSP